MTLPYPAYPRVEARGTRTVWGVQDHVVAVVAGWLAFAAVLAVPVLWILFLAMGPFAPVGALVAFAALLVACATYGLPATVVGVAVVHLACRRATGTLVPVLVAGLAGAACSGLWVAVTLDTGIPHLALLVALAAGLASGAGYGVGREHLERRTFSRAR